jgi:hypothetical protein
MAEQIQRRESKESKSSPVAAAPGTPIVRKSVVVGGVVPTVVQNNHVFIDLHDRIAAMQHSTQVYGGELESSYRHFMSQYQHWCNDHPLLPLPPDVTVLSNATPVSPTSSSVVDAVPTSATLASWGLGESKTPPPIVRPLSPEVKEGEFKAAEAQVEGGREMKRPSSEAAVTPPAAGPASIKAVLSYRTTVGVVQRDCLDEARDQIGFGHRVALLNLASRINICGAWDNPYLGTQEECIERRSAVYRHGMDWRMNPTFHEQLITTSAREGRGQWQWRDDHGIWTRFDGDAAIFLSRLTNDSESGVGVYRIGKYRYEFNLLNQTQQNLRTKKIRPIRYT